MAVLLSHRKAWELAALALLIALLAVLCIALAPGARAQSTGEILGTVTALDTGLPVQNVTVQAYDSNGYATGLPANTDVNGLYTLTVPEGNCRVAYSPQDGLHGGIFYSSKNTLAAADYVSVVGGEQTLGIDQALPAAGATGDILGTVTVADGGTPLSGVQVQAYASTGEPAGLTAVTNTDGQYIVSSLTPGEYKLHFKPVDSVHVAIYYHDQTSLETATPVTVNSGAMTTGIDQVLPLGGSISGVITGAENGQPLSGCDVRLTLLVWHVHYWEPHVLSVVSSDTNGNYKFEGLEPGPYEVEAACADKLHYDSWFWDGKSEQSKADAIFLTAGMERTGIDIGVPIGCNIHGTIRDSFDAPVGGVACTAYKYNSASKTWETAGSDTSSTDLATMGRYSMGPVPPGTYKVDYEPSDPGHVGIWYNNKETMAEATSFDLTLGQSRAINPVVPNAVVIKGMVMSNDDDLTPIEGVTVNAYRKVGSSWKLQKTIQTLPSGGDPSKPNWADWGTYQLNTMRPGTYTLRFVPGRNFWYSQWWKRKTSQSSATQFVLQAGESMTDTNVLLDWVTRNPGPIPPGQVTPPSPPGPHVTPLPVPAGQQSYNMDALAVTSADSSDLAPRLAGAGYGYTVLSLDMAGSYDIMNLSLLKRFDVVFLNCSSNFIDGYMGLELAGPTPLSEYVASGGKVYAADCSSEAIRNDFQPGPGEYLYDFYNPPEIAVGPPERPKQIVHSTITDAAMRSKLGISTWNITYEKGGNAVLMAANPGGTVNMQGSVVTDHIGTANNSPMSLVEPFGAGKVYVQSFHLNQQDAATSTKMLHYFFGVMGKPEITSISPTSGSVGATVKITGKNFGSVRSTSFVRFNDVTVVTYRKWTSTEIQVIVPSGASTGLVKVQTDGGTSNGKIFTVNGAAAGSTWYLAEGSTNYGFTTYVVIENPNSSPVTAQVTYMTSTGAMSRPDIVCPGYSQTTLNPGNDLGQADFSTKIVCKEAKTIAVDRRMIWTGQGAPSQEGHSSIGVTSPQKVWYLPEGSSKWGFDCWLLVQNPTDNVASLTVTYMIEGEGPSQVTKSVPANSRMTWNMGNDIGLKDASIKIASNQMVIAERSMYRNGNREGSNSIGTNAASNDYYLAEGTTGYGFTTYVLIQNPNTVPADVTVTYMTNSGPAAQPVFSLPANSRKTIRVNDVAGMANKDFSTKVSGSQPIIAERSMYWGAGTPLGEACHDSIGLASPHTAFYLPDGATDYGHETWTCVQNPNSTPVNVEVIYLPAGGTSKEQPLLDTIPANSRKTYNMADKIPSGKASVQVTCTTTGKKIMVERSMYWYNRGAGTNTIGGYTDAQ